MKLFPVTHYEAMMNSVYGAAINDLFGRMDAYRSADYLTFCDALVKEIESSLLGNADENQLMVGIQSLQRMMANQESMNLMGNMLWHCWQMRHNGERIYYVAKDLCHRLIHTRANVSCEYVKAPFDEIYVCLDQSEIVIDDRIDNTVRPMRGMYIGLKKESSGKTRMRVMASSGGAGIENRSDINYHYVLDIPDSHATVDDAINIMMRDLGAGKITAFSLTDVNRNMIQESFRLAVNILLYITSKDADTLPVKPDSFSEAADKKTNPAKAKKLLEKIGRFAQYPFIMVGPNVPPLESEAISSRAGGKITCMFSVSGHWRWQWKGPKDTQTQEHIWIAPYTKGKGLIEGLHKKYIVEER